MRKILVGIAMLSATFGIATIKQVQEAKPANAAIYCAPWQDYWCYQKYLRCGPYFWIWPGIYIDKCGNQVA